MVKRGWIRPVHVTARHIRRAFAIAAMGVALAAVYANPVAAAPACADRVLDEWTSGTLTSAHAPDCYEAAIDALPEDLRAYTSAADDISRAMDAAARADRSDRQLASAPVSSRSEDVRAFPTFVVVLAVFVGLLAASGLAASLVRRHRLR